MRRFRTHRRPKPHSKRDRSHAYNRRRLSVLKSEPLCRPCKASGYTKGAEEVDHIVPLHKGGTDDRDNLQPICRECHAEKTMRERTDLRGCDEDGTPYWRMGQ